MKITDEMLYQAAPEAAERWLATLPEREDCGHDFSLTFQAAMEPILRRRRRRWRTLFLLAAVVAALGALLALSAVAERPDEYRVYASQEDGIVFLRAMPKDDGSGQEIHQLTPEWLPEGFTLDRGSCQEDEAKLYYYCQEDSERYFGLTQYHGKEYTGTLMGGFQLEHVRVDGEDAILVSSPIVSYLLWTKGADTFFLTATGLEQEDIIRIAENLKW